MAVNCDRAIPEQCRQSPGVGTGYCRKVHECGQAAVAPVSDSLVDQVGNQDDLGAPEMIPGPQEDPGKEEQIVQDEVGGHIGGGCDQNIVLREQVPHVAELGEQKENPTIELESRDKIEF